MDDIRPTRGAFGAAAPGHGATAGLTACGDNDTTTDNVNDGSDGGPTTVRMSGWGGATRHRSPRAPVEDADAGHPGVRSAGTPPSAPAGVSSGPEKPTEATQGLVDELTSSVESA